MSKIICSVPRCEYHATGHYSISSASLKKRGIHILVTPLWQHYIEKHRFLVHTKLHSLIMDINPSDDTLEVDYMHTKRLKQTSEMTLLDVKYDHPTRIFDHQQGGIDYNFIKHMHAILARCTNKDIASATMR